MKIINQASCDIFIPSNTMIELIVDVKKPKNAVVNGIIKDEDNVPVKNAVVQLYDEQNSELEKIIITDSDGMYTFIINDTKKGYTIKACY